MELKKEFIDFACREFDKDTAEALCKAIVETEPVVSVRVNHRKAPNDIHIYNSGNKVGWAENGFYLSERPLFTMDPLFHAGAYYVQEASSMFVEQAFRQYLLPNNSNPKVLDLCAAPGGKSTHIISLLDGQGFVLSNEIMKNRAKILCENVSKWGYPNCAVSNCSPAEIGEKLNGVFDAIVVDAPCSGEGMFRKDEEAVNEWSEANVKMCAERQKEILAAIAPTLKTGGLLVYSTCTFNKYEDELNMDFIEKELGMRRVKIDVKSEWNITENNCGYHFFPHKTKGEGFFLSAFVKEVDEYEMDIRPKKQKKGNKPEVKTPDEIKAWLNSSDYDFIGTCAVPAEEKNFVQLLIDNLRVMQYGVNVYESKGKDYIPQHNLAISTIIERDSFLTEDVDLETAIQFLKKENIAVNVNEKGWVLITYRGVPLGFVKQVGGRTNNAYPQNWRILMCPDLEKYTEVL